RIYLRQKSVGVARALALKCIAGGDERIRFCAAGYVRHASRIDSNAFDRIVLFSADEARIDQGTSLRIEFADETVEVAATIVRPKRTGRRREVSRGGIYTSDHEGIAATVDRDPVGAIEAAAADVS